MQPKQPMAKRTGTAQGLRTGVPKPATASRPRDALRAELRRMVRELGTTAAARAFMDGLNLEQAKARLRQEQRARIEERARGLFGRGLPMHVARFAAAIRLPHVRSR